MGFYFHIDVGDIHIEVVSVIAVELQLVHESLRVHLQMYVPLLQQFCILGVWLFLDAFRGSAIMNPGKDFSNNFVVPPGPPARHATFLDLTFSCSCFLPTNSGGFFCDSAGKVFSEKKSS